MTDRVRPPHPFWLGTFLLLLALPGSAQSVPEGVPAQVASVPWDRLLAAGRLDRKSAQLEASRPRHRGRWALPLFNRLWDDWLAVAPAADAVAREAEVDNSVAPAARLLGVEFSEDLRRTTREAALRQYRTGPSLVAALADLHRFCGAPLTAEQEQKLRAAVAAVPPDAARAAALLVFASQRAAQARDRALSRACPPDQRQALFDEARRFADWFDLTPEVLARLEAVDLYSLCLGALQLEAALEVVQEQVQEAAYLRLPAPFRFEWDTPLGKVALGGIGDDTYPAGAYLLLLDAGGNDLYQGGGGTPDAAHPVSVILDRAGNDRYESSGDYAFGAGVLGYGFLYDLAGDDQYKLENVGLGAGVAGVGVLRDQGGKDHYQAVALTQGSGTVGIGLLSDWGDGDDAYDCYFLAQGYGAPRGIGLLADSAGNDRYTANDTDLKAPSPQSDKHNVSMAQGAGFGRRDDQSNDMCLAGGVGLLVDSSGNDTYSGGVFCSGISYWYCLGFLVDRAGNDRYSGVWYSQGATAHYSIAALLEGGGDDTYNVSMCTSLGSGHDYSISVVWESGGDDVYTFGGAIGWGNANGIGVFADLQGNDDYRTGPLGQANSPRPGQFNLGLFYDGGGQDKLPPGDPLAGLNRLWVRPTAEDQPRSLGLGLQGRPAP